MWEYVVADWVVVDSCGEGGHVWIEALQIAHMVGIFGLRGEVAKLGADGASFRVFDVVEEGGDRMPNRVFSCRECGAVASAKATGQWVCLVHCGKRNGVQGDKGVVADNIEAV